MGENRIGRYLDPLKESAGLTQHIADLRDHFTDGDGANTSFDEGSIALPAIVAVNKPTVDTPIPDQLLYAENGGSAGDRDDAFCWFVLPG